MNKPKGINVDRG